MTTRTRTRPPGEAAAAPAFEALRARVAGGTDFIIGRLIVHARAHGYARYTSTLREAWRVSVLGLSESLVDVLEHHGDVPALAAEEEHTDDPVAAFAVREARLHRERGVPLEMFLGLLKYYRRAYHELVDADLDADLDEAAAADAHACLERFFDRVEIGFLVEWSERSDDELLGELRDTNRRLTNEKNRYLTIHESLAEPVVVLDADEQLVNLNHAAVAAFLGARDPGACYYGRAEVVDLLPWLPGVLAAAGRGERETRLWIQTTVGRRRFVVRVAEMLDISAKFAGTVIVLDDVTEQELAQAEIERARDELELRVEERTAELKRVHEQLLHTQKLEAIGTLAGGVAHDLNNLLQVVLAASDLLAMRRRAEDPREDELFGQIGHATERAVGLVRQLLLFSRRQPMEFAPLDVNASVDQLTKMLTRLLGETVSLEVTLTPELPPVVGDVGSLEQVLMNLVVNARDAMPDGGRIDVRTDLARFDEGDPLFPDVRAGEFVRLSVEDDGLGMDADTRARIFEPFFTTKPAGEGTGLGLAVVYGIVQHHGGWIDVYSEPGTGTVFKVYLPVAEGKAPDAGERAPSLDALRGDGRRILLVEDERDVRRVTTAALEEAGYAVTAAADAETALEQFAAPGARFDCVVTDAVLPGRSGPQMVEVMLRRVPTQPVLFVSGYTAHAAGWQQLEQRGHRLLPKPYSLRDLLRVLRAVIAAGPPGSAG